MTIENTPELLSFMQLWMMSGGMVLHTLRRLVETNRGISLPSIEGRNFKSEVEELAMLMNQMTSRLT